MRKQIKHRAILYGPFDAEPDGAQEIVELPTRVAESADVADGTHGDINQSGGIHERLRRGLSLHDTVEYFPGRGRAGIAIRMRRVFATHPFEAAVEHHLL